MEPHVYLNSEVVFYAETGGFGYYVKGRTLGEPFIIIASHGKYPTADTALSAAEKTMEAICRAKYLQGARRDIKKAQLSDGVA